MASISARNVVIQYKVFRGSSDRSLFGSLARSSVGRRGGEGTVKVTALNNVGFDISDGERVGLIGRNGSGKTTCLRLMAQMIEPTHGGIEVDGTTRCLFNIMSGLDGDKTGYGNIEFMSRFHGVPKKQISEIAADVVEFTGLGDFLDVPVRTYSSGMLMRLCFALATARPSDILLVDEVFAVGDRHFVDRAQRRIENMFSSSRVMVMATHSPELLMNICTRAIWLDGGNVMADGSPEEVWRQYCTA